MQNFDTDDIIFSQNDLGNDFYVILEGLAQIMIDKQPFAIYEAGKLFGELAITTDNPHRRATVLAKSSLSVLRIPKNYYKAFSSPAIQDRFNRIRNHFCDHLHPRLIASLTFGKMEHWSGIKKWTIPNDGKALYIIIAGELKVKSQGRRKVANLGVGDVVGGVEIQNDRVTSLQINTSSEDVCVIHLRQNAVKRLFKLFPSFYVTVCQRMKKLEGLLT